LKSKERCQWEIKESSRPCGKAAKQRLHRKPYCQRHFDILRSKNPAVQGFNRIQEELASRKPKKKLELKTDESFY